MTTSAVSTPFRAAPSATVANSSSDSATDPVRRTVTPFSGVRPSLEAAARMASVALPPGCRSSKSSIGWMFTKRRKSDGSGARPVISLRQEKAGSFPVSRSSKASAMATRAGLMSSSFDFPRRTPSIDCDKVRRTPRSVGSAERVPRKGLGADQFAGVAAHFLDAEEENAVAGEELTAVRTADAADHLRTRRKVARERSRCLVGGFGRRGVDDGNDLIGSLREGPVEHDLLLAPGQRAREKLAAVGVDGEMARQVARRKGRHEQEAQDDEPGMAARQAHGPGDSGDRHGIVILDGGIVVGRLYCVAWPLGQCAPT